LTKKEISVRFNSILRLYTPIDLYRLQEANRKSFYWNREGTAISDFSQKSSKITTFHILRKDRKHLRSQLSVHSRWKKTVLIIPLLAEEYTNPNNLPVFQNILKQLKDLNYVSSIIFGVDRASEQEVLLLRQLVIASGIRNYLIQWNDGPGFQGIYHQLTEAGFNIQEPGKGKNMFLSFGIAIAIGGHSIGLVDADIRTFRRVQLERLLYPVVVLGYDFSKAFYARISDGQMYGRVKRLLLDPLLLALKRKFSESKEEKMLHIIDFLLGFHYQLSGEVAFHVDLLKRMRFATNWGVEIFTLIEVYRKASSTAQVMFTDEPFDHKHQEVSPTDETKGLNRMAVDILTSLMNALVIEEGLEISDTFFRDLAITYQAVAEEQIKKYSEDASFSNLNYDRDAEEYLVKEVFRSSVLRAGDVLTSPYRLSERFLRLVNSHPEFRPYLENGLAETILEVEANTERRIFEVPQTVSWERVTNKLPRILYDLIEVVEKEKQLYL
jgi:glucosyl-3-phosphoglycerate synthase